MHHAMRGAQSSLAFKDGDMVGILPGLGVAANRETSPYSSIVLATGVKERKV